MTGIAAIPGLGPNERPVPRLVVGFDGTAIPPELERLVARGAVAGVVIFARNLESTAQWFELQRSIVALFPDLAPIIAVDQEGGLVQRLKAPRIPEFPTIPPMGDLGHLLTPNDFEWLGTRMGEQLLALGFNTNFAPVLDIHSRPENPIIGKRAFGNAVEPATTRALAFWRGLEASGVRGCGKHFPGHGDTTRDSHIELPIVPRPRAELEALELQPFRAALAGPGKMLMTAHVLYPALDPEWPATLSPAIINGLLRRQLGWDGLVISDDLDMGALAGIGDPSILARQLDAAGVDLALVCRDLGLASALADHLHAGAGPTANRIRRFQHGLARPVVAASPDALPTFSLPDAWTETASQNS